MISRLSAAVLLLLSSLPAFAATVLTFEVVSHNQPLKNAKLEGKPHPDSSYALTVTLAGETLIVDTPERVEVRDFNKKRILVLDKQAKTYAESSLYADIGFRVKEFGNRMMLGHALAAGKVVDNPMQPALVENILALSDPANATVIDAEKRGDDTLFLWKKQELARVNRQTRAASPEIVAEYVRFLRYSAGGHPQILAAIQHGAAIPERLTLILTNVGIETRTYTLRSIDSRETTTPSVDGFERKYSDDTISVKRFGSDPAAELDSRTAALRQARDDDVDGGRLFDAMLTNLSMMLATGDAAPATEWLKAHRDQIGSLPEMQIYSRSLQPHDADSARQGADALASLRRPDLAHGYVLDIFEANVRLGLRQVDAAEKLMRAALSADPTTTGAWIDLGTIFEQEFRADLAWDCWDIARTLRPSHFMLQHVDDLEKKLRTAHPEFF